jgi:L-ascorbate metabolism protein UlaG (beta-lactamase superfamily)
MSVKSRFLYNKRLPFIAESPGNLVINGQFVQNHSIEPIPRLKLLKWMFSPNPKRAEKRADNWRPTVIPNNDIVKDDSDKLVWLGHASFYIKMGKYRLLTDPVFNDLTPLLRRRHSLPCSPTCFTDINYILLSHGHRDHLDLPTLKLLAKQNPNCTILCPLGFDNLIRSIGFIDIQEAAWYQQFQTPDDLKIVFLPAKHWNRRFLWDYNTTLWGSHWIEYRNASVYFAGDTAMDGHFEKIRKYLGKPDYSLLPVGAYLPRYVMEWAHIAPWEAVEAFQILESNFFIPMHFGTFDLSDEPASEPYQLLKQYEAMGQFKNAQLLLPTIGELISIQ